MALVDEDAFVNTIPIDYWTNPQFQPAAPAEEPKSNGGGGWAILLWILFGVALLILLFLLWNWLSTEKHTTNTLVVNRCPGTGTSTAIVPVIVPSPATISSTSTGTTTVVTPTGTVTGTAVTLAAAPDPEDVTLSIPTRFGPYRPRGQMMPAVASAQQAAIAQQQMAAAIEADHQQDMGQSSLALGPQQPLKSMQGRAPSVSSAQAGAQVPITGGVFAPGAFDSARAATLGRRKLKPVNRNQRTFVKVGQRQKIPNSNRASHENALRLLPSETVPSDSRLAKVVDKWAGKTPGVPSRDDIASLHNVRQEQVLLQQPIATCGGPKISSDFTITRAELPKPTMPHGMDFNQPVRR